jgi:hypothetical protein
VSANHQHVVRVDGDGPGRFERLFRVAFQNAQAHRAFGFGKTDRFVKSPFHLARLAGVLPFLENRGIAAGIQDRARFRILDLEQEVPAAQRVDGLVRMPRPRQWLDDDLVQAEGLGVRVAGVVVVDAESGTVRRRHAGRGEKHRE